jgi:hypothetical protein
MRSILKAAALAALLAAGAVAAPDRNSRSVESTNLDQKTTAKKRYELAVPEAGTRVRLRVWASVREGEIKIVARDAAGNVRQEALLSPSKSKPGTYDVDSREAKSSAGVWVIEVEATGAVGSYGFTFTQNGG